MMFSCATYSYFASIFSQETKEMSAKVVDASSFGRRKDAMPCVSAKITDRLREKHIAKIKCEALPLDNQSKIMLISIGF